MVLVTLQHRETADMHMQANRNIGCTCSLQRGTANLTTTCRMSSTSAMHLTALIYRPENPQSLAQHLSSVGSISGHDESVAALSQTPERGHVVLRQLEAQGVHSA